ncbi:MAG: hypothetical protein HZA31_05675 [Opitutae bacterium]|nr:hypothetical protein [Opitutae bacterium]
MLPPAPKALLPPATRRKFFTLLTIGVLLLGGLLLLIAPIRLPRPLRLLALTADAAVITTLVLTIRLGSRD